MAMLVDRSVDKDPDCRLKACVRDESMVTLRKHE
jgi:hypothetical protein